MSGTVVDAHEPAVEEVTPPAKPDPWTSLSSTDTGDVTEVTPAPEPVTEPTTAERDEQGKFTSNAGKKKRDDPSARVKDATAEALRQRDARAAAEARASELEREIQSLKSVPAVKAETSEFQPTRPKPSADEIGTKYATYEDYNEDVVDWKLEQREAKREAETTQKAETDRATRERQAIGERLKDIRTRGKEAYHDYDDVIKASTENWITPMHQLALLQHPNAEAVIYALAKDPALAQEIAGIDNPYQLGLRLATLTPSAAVARPDSAPTVRPSSAKPPINRVGGAANATVVSPDELEWGPEYIRVMNRRDKERDGRL